LIDVADVGDVVGDAAAATPSAMSRLRKRVVIIAVS
jgi:hypothetical protein